MNAIALPAVRDLDRRDINAILARNITGRIAFAANGEIEILPVNFVRSEDVIYLRCSATGRIASTDPAGTRVAFEVDEIQSTHRWRSVVLHGTLLRVERETEHEEWMRAVGKLRRLTPEVLRESDSAGHRSALFRVLVHDVTGKAMG